VVTDIPVQPDADTARDWAIRELAKDQYQDHGLSFSERVLRWIGDRLDDLFSIFSIRVGGTPVGAIVVIGVAAVIAYILIRVTAGPIRRSFHTRRTHSVFEDDLRTAAQMRSAANDAASRGDWNLAVLERFRAIVRSLEDRDLIDDHPGVTADEAAIETGRRFPDCRDRILEAAALFDSVRYGHAIATSEDDAALRHLDALLASRTLLSAVST
jgi:hypothetical protein